LIHKHVYNLTVNGDFITTLGSWPVLHFRSCLCRV